MKTIRWIALALAAFAMVAVAPKAAPPLDEARIEAFTGAKGKLDPKEGVFKVSAPRSDLEVRAEGVKITPPMGLTSWAAFKRMGAKTVVMGDMVLREDQVNPVLSAALDNGLEVTALHNHFAFESPRIMFLHIEGMGSDSSLARAVGSVFARIRDTATAPADATGPEIDPAATTLDPSRIEAILHEKGTLADGVYKVVVGRTSHMHGVVVGSTMGVNTWAAFAGSDERAVVDGDFAMAEGEVQGVLKALRGAGINIVAIHQHMIGETPRIVFLHYWGRGSTEALARGLRAALDRTRHG